MAARGLVQPHCRSGEKKGPKERPLASSASGPERRWPMANKGRRRQKACTAVHRSHPRKIETGHPRVTAHSKTPRRETPTQAREAQSRQPADQDPRPGKKPVPVRANSREKKGATVPLRRRRMHSESCRRHETRARAPSQTPTQPSCERKPTHTCVAQRDLGLNQGGRTRISQKRSCV